MLSKCYGHTIVLLVDNQTPPGCVRPTKSLNQMNPPARCPAASHLKHLAVVLFLHMPWLHIYSTPAFTRLLTSAPPSPPGLFLTVGSLSLEHTPQSLFYFQEQTLALHPSHALTHEPRAGQCFPEGDSPSTLLTPIFYPFLSPASPFSSAPRTRPPPSLMRFTLLCNHRASVNLAQGFIFKLSHELRVYPPQD